MPSICPYCGVGFGQLIRRPGKYIVNIEGNPESPISQGFALPQGLGNFSARRQSQPRDQSLVPCAGPGNRQDEAARLGDGPHAHLVKKTRDETFRETCPAPDGAEKKVNNTLGVASLGGATIDNEWNYMQAKLTEPWAWCSWKTRPGYDTARPCPVWALLWPRRCDVVSADLENADSILIMGSNMAECHPVAFRWVMQAKTRWPSPPLIHVDPRFAARARWPTSMRRSVPAATSFSSARSSSTSLTSMSRSSKAQLRPLSRASSSSTDYIVHYTNAAAIIKDEFKDTEDLAGLFAGYDPDRRSYDSKKWRYDSEPAATANNPNDKQPRQSFSDTVGKMVGPPPGRISTLAA